MRFNTEDFPARSSITWGTDDCALRTRSGREVNFSELGSIWYRRPVAPAFDTEPLEPGRAHWAAWESLDVLRGVWRSFAGLWVNNPDREEQASSKLEQLRRAAALGFVVPRTLVTNDASALSRFAAENPHGVVCKPVHSGQITVNGVEHLFFTTLMTDAELEAFPAVGSEPYMFQSLVEKESDIRVTVMGDRVFAVRIESQAFAESRIDWRRGDHETLGHSVFDLPDDLAQRCLRLVRSYGLEFGAIDLAWTPEGGAVFFEINPGGQWAWLEEATGLPLRATLAALLESGVGSHG